MCLDVLPPAGLNMLVHPLGNTLISQHQLKINPIGKVKVVKHLHLYLKKGVILAHFDSNCYYYGDTSSLTSASHEEETGATE